MHSSAFSLVFHSISTGEKAILEGDIFISIDRVKENALNLGISFQKELFRVMVHGMLHLIGYPDKTDKEKKEMRRQEDIAIALSK